MQMNGAAGNAVSLRYFVVLLNRVNNILSKWRFPIAPLKVIANGELLLFPNYCANYKSDVCLIGYIVRAIISGKQGGMQDEFNGYSKERQ